MRNKTNANGEDKRAMNGLQRPLVDTLIEDRRGRGRFNKFKKSSFVSSFCHFDRLNIRLNIKQVNVMTVKYTKVL